MPFTLPQGYSIYGTANSGGQLTAIKSGNTAAKPLLLIIDRNQPVFNNTTGAYTVGSYRVRVIRGQLDSDGDPRPERLLVDANIRMPVGTDSEHVDLLTDFVAFVNQTDFASSAMGNLLFPEVAPEV